MTSGSPPARYWPEIDLAEAENSRERRADRLPLDHGADFPDLRVGLPIFGGRAVELGARDDALVEQPLHPIEREPRQFALRLERGQLRLLLPRVEHGQHVARAHGLPGLEENPFDRAGRSALTVTPCTAAIVPIALSVAGHSSCFATIVVTASGGG